MMKKREVMLVGRTGVGKTTLIQKLYAQRLVYKKTQATEYSDHFIDTPGEYTESPRFYSNLITLSVDAKKVALVASATCSTPPFPPGFAKSFHRPVVGIITKIDLAEEKEERVKGWLLDAGAQRVFSVSAVTGEGIDGLAKTLLDIDA